MGRSEKRDATACLAAAIHVLEGRAFTIVLVATIMFAFANVHSLWLDPLGREKRAARRPVRRSR